MKNKFYKMLFLVLSLSLQALGSDYGYQSTLDRMSSCRETLEGCTTQQEMEIARFKGIFLGHTELQEYLSRDTAKSFFIPLDLSNNELLTLAVATSLGIVAFKNDQEIMNVIQNNKTEVTSSVAKIGNFLGSTPGSMSIAAGSYFLGVCFKDNKLKSAGLFMVGASLATSIVVGAAKVAFGRARPNTGTGPYNFHSGGLSFYSGHTTEIFTIATVISEMYKKDHPVIPYVAYGIAAITGYARMHDKAHWASDVMVGAIAGHFITKLALNYVLGDKENSRGIQIYPGIDPKTGTYSLLMAWKGKERSAPLKCAQLPLGSIKIEACLNEAFQ
jgi:membrane-associated phospholipid phosphatase